MNRPQMLRAIYDDDGPARVMAVVDGYVMARRKGAMPFLVPLAHIDSKRFDRWKTLPKYGPFAQ